MNRSRDDEGRLFKEVLRPVHEIRDAVVDEVVVPPREDEGAVAQQTGR